MREAHGTRVKVVKGSPRDLEVSMIKVVDKIDKLHIPKKRCESAD